MDTVITYRLAYLDVQVDLCDACVSHGDHRQGVLGPVSYGAHDGICEGAHHRIPVAPGDVARCPRHDWREVPGSERCYTGAAASHEDYSDRRAHGGIEIREQCHGCRAERRVLRNQGYVEYGPAYAPDCD